MICELCGELLLVGEDREHINVTEWAHRTCLLRHVVGGIGHLEDHNYWCIEQHDPDGGRSLYQSGLEVDAWIARHGHHVD